MKMSGNGIDQMELSGDQHVKLHVRTPRLVWSVVPPLDIIVCTDTESIYTPG